MFENRLSSSLLLLYTAAPRFATAAKDKNELLLSFQTYLLIKFYVFDKKGLKYVRTYKRFPSGNLQEPCREETENKSLNPEIPHNKYAIVKMIVVVRNRVPIRQSRATMYPKISAVGFKILYSPVVECPTCFS